MIPLKVHTERLARGIGWLRGPASVRSPDEGALRPGSRLRTALALAGVCATLVCDVAAGGRSALAITGTFVEFDVPTGGSMLAAITAGPDGNLWFTEPAARKIGRITPAGVITEYPLPAESGQAESKYVPTRITAGPDGNLWFAAVFGVGRITPAGLITLFGVQGGGELGSIWGITPGPDGNLWYTANGNDVVGKLDPLSGDSRGFGLPGARTRTSERRFPTAITAGPDGNLWFIESGGRIGQMTSAGALTEYLNPDGAVNAIAASRDGNVWFATLESIAKITPAGEITTYPVPGGVSDSIEDLGTGPEGNIWFTFGSNIGASAATGQMSVFSAPYTGGRSTRRLSVTTGPDRGLWFVEPDTNRIGRFTPPPTPQDFLPVAFFDFAPSS